MLTLSWLKFLVNVKITAFWNVMSCSSVNSYILKEPASSIHLEDQLPPQKWSLYQTILHYVTVPHHLQVSEYHIFIGVSSFLICNEIWLWPCGYGGGVIW